MLLLPRANHKLCFNLLALSQRSIYFRSLLIWDSRSGIVAAEKVTLVVSVVVYLSKSICVG